MNKYNNKLSIYQREIIRRQQRKHYQNLLEGKGEIQYKAMKHFNRKDLTKLGKKNKLVQKLDDDILYKVAYETIKTSNNLKKGIVNSALPESEKFKYLLSQKNKFQKFNEKDQYLNLKSHNQRMQQCQQLTIMERRKNQNDYIAHPSFHFEREKITNKINKPGIFFYQNFIKHNIVQK